jgi:hypothetical protein
VRRGQDRQRPLDRELVLGGAGELLEVGEDARLDLRRRRVDLERPPLHPRDLLACAHCGARLGEPAGADGGRSLRPGRLVVAEDAETDEHDPGEHRDRDGAGEEEHAHRS